MNFELLYENRNKELVFNIPVLEEFYDEKVVDFSVLKGLTFKNIFLIDDEDKIKYVKDITTKHVVGIIFVTLDNKIYKLQHQASCCEKVYIESINGDLDDLYNNEILLAELVSHSCDDKYPPIKDSDNPE